MKEIYIQPFVCIMSSRKTEIKCLPALIEGNQKECVYDKLISHLIPQNGNLMVLHCFKGKQLSEMTFSLPEPKAQVNFLYQKLSVVVNVNILNIFVFLDQCQPNKQCILELVDCIVFYVVSAFYQQYTTAAP